MRHELKTHTTFSSETRRRRNIRMYTLAVLAVLCVATVFALGLYANEQVVRWMEGIRSQGVIGVVFLLLLYVVSCVLLLPLNILTPVAGAVYGFAYGVLLVSVGITLGASASFLLGRHVLHRRVEHLIAQSPRLRGIERAVSRNGWKVVALARLCVFVPFRLSNYIFSLANISLIEFSLATWLGTLPAVCFYVYSGSVVGSLLELQEDGALTQFDWRFHVPAIILSVTLLVFASNKARAIVSEIDREAISAPAG